MSSYPRDSRYSSHFLVTILVIRLKKQFNFQSRIRDLCLNEKIPLKEYNLTRSNTILSSLFQALGLWGKSEKAGERGKDERGHREPGTG